MEEWDYETGRVRVNFLRALDAAAEAVRNIDADENYHYHNSPRHEFDFFRNPDGESFPGRFRWGPYRAAEQREQIPWDKIKLAQSRLNKIRLQQQCRMEMQRRNDKNNASTAKKGQSGSGSQSSSAEQKQQMDDDTDDDAILRLAPKKLTLDELVELFGESSDDYTSDDEDASGDKAAPGNEGASGDKATSDNDDASVDKAAPDNDDASGDRAASGNEDASGDEDASGSEDASGDEDAIVEAKSV